MSVEISAEWNMFDLIVTIDEWEDDTLEPISGSIVLDGVGKTDSLQDRYLACNAAFIKDNQEDIFEELFSIDNNLEVSYNAINNYLYENRVDAAMERDVEEWNDLER